jgi:DNA modification methylase
MPDPVLWPADKAERRALSSLRPYPRNARTHSAEQIEKIAASIQAWGFTMPVLIDERGGIIVGHARVAAAKLLDLAEVPVIVAAGWSDAQKRAYVLADNRLALDAGWDDDLLHAELKALADLDFDLSLIGFDEDELNSLAAEPFEGLTDPDEAPEPSANPVSLRGEVWRLGRHRLVCGDATSADDVAAALNGVQPRLMVTDPPYGVDYDPDWRVRDNPAQYKGGKTTSVGVVVNDERADWTDAWSLSPTDVAYVWHGGRYASAVQSSLEASGYDIRCQIIWAKQGFVFGRGDYHWQHEPCWYAVRKGATGHWSGDRKQTTLWQIANLNTMKGGKPDDMTTGHSAQKPVECMKRPIENNSNPGQAVYDPFVGSGTTIIAAEMTGRACHALEIAPAYVDVSVQRWQAFTGQSATLEATGQSFAEVAARRAG